MTAPATGAARIVDAPRPLLRAGLVTLGVAGFLAISEAFGLGLLPFPERLLYWLWLLGLGQVGSLAVRRSLDGMPVPFGRVVIAAAVECLALALPMTLVVWATTSFALREPLRPLSALHFYVPVLAVTALMVVANLLTQRRPLETHAHAQPGAPLAPARILERLPGSVRGGMLYALQAEDHYVRFHTSRGSDLVLLRFSDALSELDGLEGAQVHRSWWIAKAAVADCSRSNGKLVLRLVDGTKAPVSRTYADALKSAGWFVKSSTA